MRAFFIHMALLMLSLQTFAAEEHSRQVEVGFEPKTILIGHPSVLTLQVEVPVGGVLVWPDASEIESHDIEIIRFGQVDTIARTENTLIAKQVHTVTAWKEAFIPLPPLSFKQILENDTVFLESTARLLQVKGVDVDIEQDIKDIKPLFRIPYSWRDFLPYVLALLILAALVYFVVNYLKKRKKTEKQVELWDKPEVPAHIAALSRLEMLNRKELWQQGHIKQYYSELTMILRKYISKRFHIQAIEMSTTEIMNILPSSLTEDSAIALVRDILLTADLVKFAKFRPEDQEHVRTMEDAMDFVKTTIPQERNVE